MCTGLEVGIDLRKSQEAAVAGVQAGRELGERQAGRQWVEHGLGRTLAFPLSEVGAVEGSEQRGDTPDSGIYRHPPKTGGATVCGREVLWRTGWIHETESNDGAWSGPWKLETWSNWAFILAAGHIALLGLGSRAESKSAPGPALISCEGGGPFPEMRMG